MRRCCAQLINSHCRLVNASGLTVKYANDNIMYNSVRHFNVTPFVLKSASSSRKPAERAGKNSKRNNNNSNNSNKENNKAGIVFSHKTVEIEAVPITPQTPNENKNSTNYSGSADYNNNKLASFVKETESTAEEKEMSNVTCKASQQRKHAMRTIPSLSASVIVEPAQLPLRNTKIENRKTNKGKVSSILAKEQKQKQLAYRSRQQKREDKLINTLLLNTLVVEEKEMASVAAAAGTEKAEANIIKIKESNNSSNKNRRDRSCSSSNNTHLSEKCKKVEDKNTHVASTQRTRRAKSRAVLCAQESKQHAEVNHSDSNTTINLLVEQHHVTPSAPWTTSTANHDNNVSNDKENNSNDEVNVSDHDEKANVEQQDVANVKIDNNDDNNKVEENKKPTNSTKNSKARTSKARSSERRQSLQQQKELEEEEKQQREEKSKKKHSIKTKKVKEVKGKAKHGQKQITQSVSERSQNQEEEHESEVGNNARELNEDELIAQRASITKLFMVSDSVGFMFSAPPWDQQTILKELNEVDKAISPRPEVHNSNSENMMNSEYNEDNDNDNDDNDDSDVYDTSEYDSHLAYLANTPYFCQDKNMSSSSSSSKRRANKDIANVKGKKRNAPKPLSRKEAFMKVTDVFRRMLIEYGASHKIYIHVRDLQEQTPPVHLLPSSSSSSSSSAQNQNTCQGTQTETANTSEPSVEQMTTTTTTTTSTRQNIPHKVNMQTETENLNKINVALPAPVSVLTDLERFIKLQEWRKLAHAQAEKLKVECSVPAKYHTITRVRFADPTRMNWTIVLQSNAGKNVYEIIAELEDEERRKKLNVANTQGRRDGNHSLRKDDQVQLGHYHDNNQIFQKQHWDDIIASSGTEAVEENFEEELLEEEDEHMNDGTESSDYDDEQTSSSNSNSVKNNNNNNSNNLLNSNSATLDRRRIAFWCMQEFSKLAQNVLRNSKHGQNLHNQLKALQAKQQQQQQHHLLSSISANKLKLISCVNENNPFFLKPLLTVCATCVPRRESRLGQRVSEREFYTGKVDSSSIWLNGIKLGNFPIGTTTHARRAKKRNDCATSDADDAFTTAESNEKSKGKAHNHKRKNALVPFPLRELSEDELDNVVQRRGVPPMPRYSTRITMLIEHNELSPTDLISIAEERRGVARNERHYDSYLSMHNDNYSSNNNSNKGSATIASPFSLQEPVITECNTQRQVYEKVKAANKLNKPIRLFCLITDGSF